MQTREQWLNALADSLRSLFAESAFPLPENVKTSRGWPSKSALAKKNQRIGECWSDKCSDASVFEVFVSPIMAESVDVGAILVHELAHAAVGLQSGHKGPFRKCALAIGLEGKMTATVAGEALTERLHALTAAIGPYPHSKLSVSNKPKTQTTRMIKVECPSMPNQRIYLEEDRHGQGYWLDPDGPYGGYVYYHEWSGRVAWVCTRRDIVVDLGEVTIILSPLG